MFYVYVLKSGLNIYIGSTKNLKRRLKEHNTGKTKSTSGKEWLVIYYEAHTELEDANRREGYLKTTQGKQALRRMIRVALSKK